MVIKKKNVLGTENITDSTNIHRMFGFIILNI